MIKNLKVLRDDEMVSSEFWLGSWGKSQRGDNMQMLVVMVMRVVTQVSKCELTHTPMK